MSSWSEDRVALLKRLWGEGRTAAEIAKELGGVTRNAVIGKAHRLKLASRVSPIQQNKKSVKPKKTIPPKKILAAKIEDVTGTKKDKTERMTLLDLGARMCRWPIGDPREADFGFCGDDSIAGLPYCAEHANMAYQASTRNRIAKEEEEKIRRQLDVANKKVANR